jgi:hypothetical protein
MTSASPPRPISRTAEFARLDRGLLSSPTAPASGRQRAASARGGNRGLLRRGPLSCQLRWADAAADWVHKNLGAKNTLIAADADLVEAGFREKLGSFEAASTASHRQPDAATAGNASDPSGSPDLVSVEDSTAVSVILPGRPALRRRPFASATRTTASSWPHRLALYPAGHLPKRITFALPSHARSPKR